MERKQAAPAPPGKTSPTYRCAGPPTAPPVAFFLGGSIPSTVLTHPPGGSSRSRSCSSTAGTRWCAGGACSSHAPTPTHDTRRRERLVPTTTPYASMAAAESDHQCGMWYRAAAAPTRSTS